MKKNYYFCLAVIVASVMFIVGIVIYPDFLDRRADTEVVAVKHIENANGILYVNIDSTWLPIENVYTGTKSRDGLVKIPPVLGMEVTAFKLDDQLRFIAGEWTKEELDEFFGKNYLLMALFFASIICSAMIVTAHDLRSKEH